MVMIIVIIIIIIEFLNFTLNAKYIQGARIQYHSSQHTVSTAFLCGPSIRRLVVQCCPIVHPDWCPILTSERFSEGFMPQKLPKLDLTDAEYVANLVNVNNVVVHVQ